ncbi:hypothetical protein CUU64_18580 [Bacillus sp. V5-8f]|nr:hypothetical protein CUU64_18580 [Bacillus sp. V5-8f]
MELIPASGGIFEVTVNGALIYSKKDTGKFPKNQEIIDSMDAMK